VRLGLKSRFSVLSSGEKKKRVARVGFPLWRVFEHAVAGFPHLRNGENTYFPELP